MAAGTKFHCLTEDLAEKKHNFASDTLKLLLTNAAPSLSNTGKSDLTEIGSGNGYAAGGAPVTIISSSQSGGIYSLVADDVVFTASGGSIASFRYAVLYNDTASGDPLICYWDAGSTVSLSDGQTYTFAFGAYIVRIS